MRFLLLLLGGLASAQQYDLGLPSDPCTGGFTYTIPFQPPGSTDATLRFGTFTCTIPAPTQPFILSLNFVEPVVTGAGQRLFRVLANSLVILDQFDLWKSCGYQQPCSRTALIAIPPTNGTITLQFITQTRSAVISSVGVYPLVSIGLFTIGLGLESVTVPTDTGPATEIKIDTTVVQTKP